MREGGEKIATVYPAKWDYHKNDGNLISQVAITPRYLPTQWAETAGGGDVYLQADRNVASLIAFRINSSSCSVVAMGP